MTMQCATIVCDCGEIYISAVGYSRRIKTCSACSRPQEIEKPVTSDEPEMIAAVDIAAQKIESPVDVVYSETSLKLDPRMAFDRWTEVGSTLGRIARASGWWVGDWLLQGELMYGERYAQGEALTGLAPQTLMNYAWVSKAVPPERRREALSFSHHCEVARLEPDEQELMLVRAVDEHLTTRQIRSLIRAAADGDSPSSLDVCPACGQAVKP